MAKASESPTRYVVCPGSGGPGEGLHPPAAARVTWGRKGWPTYRCTLCYTRGFLPKGTWTEAHGMTLEQAQERGLLVRDY